MRGHPARRHTTQLPNQLKFQTELPPTKHLNWKLSVDSPVQSYFKSVYLRSHIGGRLLKIIKKTPLKMQRKRLLILYFLKRHPISDLGPYSKVT